ncbi:hypothetical protein M1M34_gp080 [Haloarcula tailed virus 2]|uniref:Uncharacterized protein n=1 Tax=Haloarcula tailed virus 2 TaxID=2877989 RepID=A0AAE9BZB0_9CAUD|nr:hypothetical protein M1M34_gp080 [Haloarcula tailed virus 2]UBF23253.1 hypothetical protein HATV-2_gp102 [Haloarcula tailed virus 2]
MAIERAPQDGHDDDLGYDRKKLSTREYTFKDKDQSKHQIVDGLKHGEKVFKMYRRRKSNSMKLVSNVWIDDLTEHR